ncbi:YihY/virulence factor BrkB family protein [Streptococcus tangpeifui]|uniref:YihY/virulence factor BrkB family protein n=1 Tax=Streptococcus tangpeifui TaxID=2709400 RepID=UPI0013EB6CC4|nr:YihY/virulence factor BrkB family protein [Streptococcus sp. ZJ373]
MKKKFLDRLVDKLNYPPLQVYLKHYRSAEIDLSSIAVAYYLLLTFFPLIVISANIFPYLDIDLPDVLTFLRANLPAEIYSNVAGIIRNLFATPSNGILGIATLAGFWTMSRSLTSLQKAFNKAYDVSQHRDFVIGHIVGIVASFFILFLLTFALLLSTLSDGVYQAVLQKKYDVPSGLIKLLLHLNRPIMVLVVWIGLTVLYFILPNVRIRKIRYTLPGTILSAVVIIFMTGLVGDYVTRTFNNLVDIKFFGSIIIFIIMFWFVLLARILITGAVLNATAQELLTGKMEGRRGDVFAFLQSMGDHRGENDREDQPEKQSGNPFKEND